MTVLAAITKVTVLTALVPHPTPGRSVRAEFYPVTLAPVCMGAPVVTWLTAMSAVVVLRILVSTQSYSGSLGETLNSLKRPSINRVYR